MIRAEEIRDARQRAGMTQAELAALVGVSQRTVGNWERGESIFRNRAAKIRAVLADYLNVEGGASLRSVSDAELLAEIARRFARAHQTTTSSGTPPVAEPTPLRPHRDLDARVDDLIASPHAAREGTPDQTDQEEGGGEGDESHGG